MDDRDQPWNFHTCKFCSYRSKSTFLMCNHVRLHRRRLNTDQITCNSETPEMYECELCEFDTDLKVNLKDHMDVFHKNKEENSALSRILGCYRCKKCKFQTHSLLVVTKHVTNCFPGTINHRNNTEHNMSVTVEVKWFTCEQCDDKFKTNTELQRHVSSKHAIVAENWFNCDHCSYKSNRSNNLKKHVQRCRAIKRFKRAKYKESRKLVQQKESAKREHCDLIMDKKKLRTHFVDRHVPHKDISWFKCEHCFFKTKRKDNFKRHNSTCGPVHKFKCVYCPIKTKNEEAFRKHLQERHAARLNAAIETGWYKCGRCDSKFKLEINLRRHVAVKHRSQKVKAKSEAAFRKHVKQKPMKVSKSATIKKTKWFKCGQCDSKFELEVNLRRHTKLKHGSTMGTALLKCDHCPYTTKRNYNLQQHSLKWCPSLRKFPCLYCKLKTKNREDLRKHVMQKHHANKVVVKLRPKQKPKPITIRGSKPFKCQHCDSKFTNDRGLRRHFIGKHAAPEDITWFKCDYCPYETKRKDCLKSHMSKCRLIQRRLVKAKKQESLRNAMSINHVKTKEEHESVTVEDNKRVSCRVRTKTEKILDNQVKQEHYVDCGKIKEEPEIGTLKDVKSFKCDHCQFQTSHIGSLRRHIPRIHPKSFKCDHCQFQTSYIGSLRRHIMRIHPTTNRMRPKRKRDHATSDTTRAKQKRDHATISRMKAKQKHNHATTDSTRAKQKHNHATTDSTRGKQKRDHAIIDSMRAKQKLDHATTNRTRAKQKRDHATTDSMRAKQKRNNATINRMRSKQKPGSVTVEPKRFKCELCELRFKDVQLLKRHFISKHASPEDITWFNCDQCEWRFKSNGKLRRHFISRHAALEDITWFKCDRCPFKAKRRDHLKEHSLTHSTKGVHYRAKAKTDENLTKAVNLNCEGFKCELCDDKFTEEVALKRHVLSKHAAPEDVTSFKCDRCLFKTASKDCLKKHSLKSHSVKKLKRIKTKTKVKKKCEKFKCELCDYKFTVEAALKRHFLSKHAAPEDVTWFNCDRCLFKSARKDCLKKHKCRSVENLSSINTKTKEDLTKSVKQNNCANNSVKTKETPGPEGFKCELCGNILTTSTALKRHFITRHAAPEEITWFKCGQCFFKAKRADGLKQHIRNRHFGDKKKKVFIKHRVKNLEQVTAKPVKAEVTTKPFKCELCDSSFCISQNLERHVITKHATPEEVVWFKCDHCWYQAKRKDTLKSHSQTCSPMETFRCVYCPFKGKDKESLVEHVKQKHCEIDDSRWIQCEQYFLKVEVEDLEDEEPVF